jgi:hypothetical protein
VGVAHLDEDVDELTFGCGHVALLGWCVWSGRAPPKRLA